jgi:hypothetical protein
MITIAITTTWEDAWHPKMCPVCKERTATAHCWLFKEPPPSSRTFEDKRKAIGEAFMHVDSDDCVRPPELAALLNR